MNLWIRKILAHLHDPPEKAYDFSAWHRERAEHYSTRFLSSQFLWKDHKPDYEAAGADRFIFPDPSKVHGLGQGVCFLHPLSGEKLDLPFPADRDTASGLITQSAPDFDSALDDRERLFLLWRCWLPMAASQTGGAALPYLPADTRIPDGSIWNHNSVVSAFDGARDAEGKVNPSLLLFQIGPVQEFIAQARSTRDLWSGSYLLSWLMAHGLKTLSDAIGTDAIIFPALRGQSLFDWLHQDTLQKGRFERGDNTSSSFWESLGLEGRKDDVLTPNLPHRFLAIVPTDFDPRIVEDAIRVEWKRIADASWDWLAKHGASPLSRAAWDFQTARTFNFAWQVVPVGTEAEVREALAKAGSGSLSNIEVMINAAKAIPEPDGRCYPLNTGSLWAGHYALTSHRMDARRACRDFEAWPGDLRAARKDAYSGREESLVDPGWHERIRHAPPLRSLFKQFEPLGAVNLVKRVWHAAYLTGRGIPRRSVAFDSVYSVAAGPWKAAACAKIKDDEGCWEALLTFADAVQEAACDQATMEHIPQPPSRSARQGESEWLQNLDAELLSEDTWLPKGNESNSSIIDRLSKVRTALRNFIKSTKTSPPAYYAVIALDGDKMGEWISGVSNPKVSSLISQKANDYFAKFPEGKQWLGSPRPVSPSFHLALSEALANFGLYAARRIVEAFHGQLIYSGGDDVLAMVPAECAIECACVLRMAFQGDPALAEHPRCKELFIDAPKGCIHLATQHGDGLPNWPLLVPGPRMTVSVGIAIGHVNAPLQDMVEEAHAAEKRAKRARKDGGLDRNGFSVSLSKRSGEIAHWGANFDGLDSTGGATLRLHRIYQELSDEDALPNRFGHRVPELIERFTSRELPLTQELADLIRAEIGWAWRQLEGGEKEKRKEREDEFFAALNESLAELILVNGRVSELTGLFAIQTFLNRHTV